jgi:hypothetical protein
MVKCILHGRIKPQKHPSKKICRSSGTRMHRGDSKIRSLNDRIPHMPAASMNGNTLRRIARHRVLPHNSGMMHSAPYSVTTLLFAAAFSSRAH